MPHSCLSQNSYNSSKIGPCPYLQGSCTVPLVWTCRTVTSQVKLFVICYYFVYLGIVMPKQCPSNDGFSRTCPQAETSLLHPNTFPIVRVTENISMSKYGTDPSTSTLGPMKASFANFQPQRAVGEISLRANPAVQCWDPRFCSTSLGMGISQTSIAAGNKVWHSTKAAAVKTSTNIEPLDLTYRITCSPPCSRWGWLKFSWICLRCGV